MDCPPPLTTFAQALRWSGKLWRAGWIDGNLDAGFWILDSGLGSRACHKIDAPSGMCAMQIVVWMMGWLNGDLRTAELWFACWSGGA
jgi:hypothetical protein